MKETIPAKPGNMINQIQFFRNKFCDDPHIIRIDEAILSLTFHVAILVHKYKRFYKI